MPLTRASFVMFPSAVELEYGSVAPEEAAAPDAVVKGRASSMIGQSLRLERVSARSGQPWAKAQLPIVHWPHVSVCTAVTLQAGVGSV